MNPKQHDPAAYTLTPLRCDCRTWSVGESEHCDLEAWLGRQEPAVRDGWVVAQLEPGVGWGAVVGGKLRWDGRLGPLRLGRLLDARVFDAGAEIHLWRDPEGALQARRRSDGGGEDVLTTQEDWFLWGTRATPGDRGWLRLSEQRGTELRLPLGGASPALPLRLRVRHYLTTHDEHLGMPSFQDLRFVALVDGRGEELRPPVPHAEESA